jgi:hypothetical protein
MGTYYTPGANKSAIIRECLSITNGTIEKHKTNGNHLWCLIATTINGQPFKYVILFKLENGGRHGWGYKPVSDDMGPYADDCPLDYVQATEAFEPRGYAAEFRERVYKRNGTTREAQLALLANVPENSLGDRYRIYESNARALGWNVKTFDQWLNS